jgi:hypothetical protein
MIGKQPLQGNHLGMINFIGQCTSTVAAVTSSNHMVVQHQHTAHGKLTCIQGQPGFIQGLVHELFIGFLLQTVTRLIRYFFSLFPLS